MTTKAISAVSALALAVALAVPAYAQSDSTPTPSDNEVDAVSTLQLDALPEHEIERVQGYCDALAGGGAAADAEPAEPDNADAMMDADAGADAQANADAGADAQANADAGASAAVEQETPSSVNQSDIVDLSTITIEACIEAGFLNDDGTPIEGDNPMSESSGADDN